LQAPPALELYDLLQLGSDPALKDHVVQQWWGGGQAVVGSPEIVGGPAKPGLVYAYQNRISRHKAEFLPG